MIVLPEADDNILALVIGFGNVRKALVPASLFRQKNDIRKPLAVMLWCQCRIDDDRRPQRRKQGRKIAVAALRLAMLMVHHPGSIWPGRTREARGKVLTSASRSSPIPAGVMLSRQAVM